MAMSTAMFQDLGAFEILLRNAMDLSLRARYQPTAAAAPWYSQVSLSDRAKETLAVAMDRAAGSSAGAPSQDKVVAELTFGFWRYLLGSRYQASVWPCVLRYSFTNVQPGGKVQRKAVEDVVLSLYLLRNRIAPRVDLRSGSHEESRTTPVNGGVDLSSDQCVDLGAKPGPHRDGPKAARRELGRCLLQSAAEQI
jgi:hypothetical protein